MTPCLTAACRDRALLVAAVLLVFLAVAAGARAADPPGEGPPDGCPASNPPNTLRLVAGSPQTTQVGRAFQTTFQVVLANTNGCPVTGVLSGVAVTFSAPTTGPSGTFAASATNQVTIGTDATGTATATVFNAGHVAGAYAVSASSAYGTVPFALSNTAMGVAASLAPVGHTRPTATVNRGYPQRLRALVLDANGQPVPGVPVTFSVGTGATGASASFVGTGATQATTTTDAHGVATSPALLANKTAGRFIATVALAGASGSETDRDTGAPAGDVVPADYRLENLAGRPAAIAPWTAEGQSIPLGRRARLRLAVRVTDSVGNPVPGVRVTFGAPRRGASGRFMVHRRMVRIVGLTTNANGVATAPSFTANRTPGGYVVVARVSRRGERTAFALVNGRRR